MNADIPSTALLDEISKIAQSNRTFSGEGVLVVTFTRVINPEGRGYQDDLQRRFEEINKCVVTITNYNRHHAAVRGWPVKKGGRNGVQITVKANNFCGVYALYIGMAHRKSSATLKIEDTNFYNWARRSQHTKEFAREVDRLMAECGLDLVARGMDLNDFEKVQHHFREYRFKVCDKDGGVLFCGNIERPEYGEVLIILEDGHYNFCTSQASLYGYRYECPNCGRHFSNKDKHSCERIHYLCGHTRCAGEPRGMSCRVCRATFKTKECYNNHLLVGPRAVFPKCETYKKCHLCGVMYTITGALSSRPAHTCGEKFCAPCDEIVPRGHLCYMKPKKALDQTKINGMEKRSLITVYDMECTQEQCMEQGRLRHVPNVICSITSCAVCWSQASITGKCKNCGERELSLTDFGDGVSTLASQFLNWAAKKARGELKGVRRQKNSVHYIIGCYAGRYDHQFLMAAALTDPTWEVSSPIMRGNKIVSTDLCKNDVTLRLLDFYNYVPKSLAAMCKAFGLDSSLAKDSFPHKFNRQQNYAYAAAALPPKENWSPEGMDTTRRTKFDKWWAESDQHLRATGELWIFKDRIVRYCQLDTQILHGALKAFALDYFELGVFPVHESSTIASLSMLIFERCFMKPKTIGALIF